MKQLNKDTEAIKYKRRFWALAARHLPHHSLLVISKSINAKQLTTRLSKRHDKTLRKSVIKAYPEQQVEAYQHTIASTKLWHGTGRLQYTKAEIKDVFAAIVKNDALNPANDVYAIFVGGNEMASLSTTPIRIIARSYADIHGKGEKETNRYGSSLWWVAYYYSLFYGLAFTKYSPIVLRNLSKWKKLSKNTNGEIAWGKKVNTKAHSVWEVFGMGSDIPGNYPILFGIKQFHRVAPLPKGIREVEVRLIDSVHLSDLSHIEVPEDKVEEVQNLLAKYNFSTPVFPVELGEYVTSKQSFAHLLGI